MGLDVSHIQLILTPDENRNFFTIDEWDLDCNVKLEHYSKYIRTIDDLDFDKSIAIVKNEKQLEELNKSEWFTEIDYLQIFIGDYDSKMKIEISKFVIDHKLDKLKTLELGTEFDNLKYHTISFGEPIKVQGVYYLDDIGYQNKGMSNVFYERYKKLMLWGNKEDFDLAYNCVGGEWYLDNWGQEAVEEMKLNFKENFIDNFEFGKSLLSVSF